MIPDRKNMRPRWVSSLHRVFASALTAGICLSVQADPAPVISVSANGSRSTELYRGMPLLVSISLIHPATLDTNASPLLLAASSGPWSNSVQLAVSDLSSNLQSWPFNFATIPSNTILLDATNYARLDCWLSPAQTLLLSNGQYSLVATLNTIGATNPSAWQGIAESVPVDLTVLNEPAPLSETNAVNKYSQWAGYEMFLGHGQSALDQISQLLALFPTNITGLELKATILGALGRIEEAQTAAEQALEAVYVRNPNPKEPPVELLLLQNQLQAELAAPVALSWSLTNQQIELSWPGASQFFYWLEVSSNLRQWSLLTTMFTVTGNRYSFLAPPTGNHQFFRVAHADLEEVLAPPLVTLDRAGAQLQVNWAGYPWFPYRLEVSSNLLSWTLLTTNFTVADNHYSFPVNPSASRQFFRVAR